MIVETQTRYSEVDLQFLENVQRRLSNSGPLPPRDADNDDDEHNNGSNSPHTLFESIGIFTLASLRVGRKRITRFFSKRKDYSITFSHEREEVLKNTSPSLQASIGLLTVAGGAAATVGALVLGFPAPIVAG